MANSSSASHVFVVGANYPPDDTRAEPGDILGEVPASTLTALHDLGALVTVPAATTPQAVSALITGLYKVAGAEALGDGLTVGARVREALPSALADLVALAKEGLTPATPAAHTETHPARASHAKKGSA